MNQKSLVAALLVGTLVFSSIGADVSPVGVSRDAATPPSGMGQRPSQDPAATARGGKVAPPAGLRISLQGNSWAMWPALFAPIVKEAGIQDQNLFDKDATPLLEKGELDAMTYGMHWWGSEEPNSFVTKTMELALKHNPNFRFYYQAAWLVGDGAAGKHIKAKDDYDNTKIVELQAANDKARKSLEGFVDGLNLALGTRAVFIVPVGDAVVKARELIVAGKLPGVKRQSEIFNDAMPHPGGPVASLAAYCYFVAIYRIPPPSGVPPPDGADQATKDAYAQQEVLRQIAWETVSEYRHAGVKVAALPKGPGNAKPVTTTNAVPASVVPEELKGWRATTGLADNAVTTDYNAYINELPPAERVGVAGVRYFNDGTGQNAVAITVNVKNIPWTHVLVYDKQNKRLRVSKHSSETPQVTAP